MTETIDFRAGQLSRAVQALAMIGAALKLRTIPGADPEIADVITGSANAMLGHDVAALDDREVSTLATMIDMTFAEAAELLHDPGRPAHWQIADPVLLQTQGRASAQAFQRILALAAGRPLLKATLRGRFLDVGTGVAGVALEAARCCPALVVDGIDIWEPALALARSNVEGSRHGDRITIRSLDVTALAAEPVYSLAWLPAMFMKRAVVEAALERIAAALRKDAYVVTACYTVPADPQAAAFARLRTLRSGGEPIAQSEMAAMLHGRGFVDIESEVAPLATFTFGRRP